MKFVNFFLFLWVLFALLDPDPDSESEYTDLIKSKSESLICLPVPSITTRGLVLKHGLQLLRWKPFIAPHFTDRVFQVQQTCTGTYAVIS
jgi:hypothetical protein